MGIESVYLMHLVPIALVGLLGPLAFAAQQRRWLSVGRALSLDALRLSATLGFALGVSGQREGFRVQVKRTTAVFVVSVASDRIPEEIQCDAAPMVGLPEAVPGDLGEREIEVGDRRFDAAIRLRGSEPLLTALLDERTRRRLWSFVHLGGGRVAKGSVQAVLHPSPALLPFWRSRLPQSEARRMAEALNEALDVARCLERPEDVVGRICDIAPTSQSSTCVGMRPASSPGASPRKSAYASFCEDSSRRATTTSYAWWRRARSAKRASPRCASWSARLPVMRPHVPSGLLGVASRASRPWRS